MNRNNHSIPVICMIVACLISCVPESSHQEIPYTILVPQDTIKVTVGNPIEYMSGFLSLNSLFQSTNGSLYVTTAQNTFGAHVHQYTMILDQNVEPVPVIKHGRGPLEVMNISLSSRNARGDTLIFLSTTSGKMVFIDNNAVKSEQRLIPETFVHLGDCFSFNNGIMAYAVEPRTSDGNLIAIHDTRTDIKRTAIPLRVNIDTVDAIRNRVFSCASLPTGFAFYFVGDRKIYIVDSESMEVSHIILGEDDPMENQVVVSRPEDANAAKPHIPKMEYYQGHLLVLFEGRIIAIDMNKPDVSLAMEFYDQDGVHLNPLEFTISDSVLYLRKGRNVIYKTSYPSNHSLRAGV